jgi:hypothetical protein
MARDTFSSCFIMSFEPPASILSHPDYRLPLYQDPNGRAQINACLRVVVSLIGYIIAFIPFRPTSSTEHLGQPARTPRRALRIDHTEPTRAVQQYPQGIPSAYTRYIGGRSAWSGCCGCCGRCRTGVWEVFVEEFVGDQCECELRG